MINFFPAGGDGNGRSLKAGTFFSASTVRGAPIGHVAIMLITSFISASVTSFFGAEALPQPGLTSAQTPSAKSDAASNWVEFFMREFVTKRCTSCHLGKPSGWSSA